MHWRGKHRGSACRAMRLRLDSWSLAWCWWCRPRRWATPRHASGYVIVITATDSPDTISVAANGADVDVDTNGVPPAESRSRSPA